MRESEYDYVNAADRKRFTAGLVEHLAGKYPARDVRLLIDMMYWGGLRVSEALAITARQMDTGAGTLRLYHTKTAESESVPMFPALRRAVVAWRTGMAPDRTILRPVPRRTTVVAWHKTVGARLGLEFATEPQGKRHRMEDGKMVKLRRSTGTGQKTVTHIWRKSIGKDMLSGFDGECRPADIEEVRSMLRHSDIRTTIVYLNAAHPERAAMQYVAQVPP